jgi:hypothetical protein
VLPMMSSEGSFLREDEMDRWQGLAVTGLYAVYEVSPAVTFEQYYPAGKYGILLAGEGDQPPVLLRIDKGRIVRVDTLLGESSEQVLQETLAREAGTLILPPLGQ